MGKEKTNPIICLIVIKSLTAGVSRDKELNILTPSSRSLVIVTLINKTSLLKNKSLKIPLAFSVVIPTTTTDKTTFR